MQFQKNSGFLMGILKGGMLVIFLYLGAGIRDQEMHPQTVYSPPIHFHTNFHEFMNMQEHRNALRDLLEEDVVPISEACSTDYSDRFTRPYECMRSFIPGVQQLHKVLAYLRDNDASWVLPENSISPYVRIIDGFGEGETHGKDVSLAFETVSANKRNTCNFLQYFRGIFYCYYTTSVPQVNVSLGPSRVTILGNVFQYLMGHTLLTSKIRVSLPTGNILLDLNSNDPVTLPILGPEQNSLGTMIDTEYVTLVGGWSNSFLLGLLTSTQLTTAGLDGITEEETVLLSNQLTPGSRSCEKEGGDPATAEWCILFPFYFYFFDEGGTFTELTGTSLAVALYNGAFDLLSTIYPTMSSAETDAVIRSCAVDSTQAGWETVHDFPGWASLLETHGIYDVLQSFYGTDGVDSVTGVGKGDLSCLIADDGHLVLDPTVLLQQESTEVVITDIHPPFLHN